MDNWWVILLVPPLLAISRVIHWSTVVVLSVVLGSVAYRVGWVVTAIVFTPMAVTLVIRARGHRRPVTGELVEADPSVLDGRRSPESLHLAG
jgi:hypothetical protein